MLYIFNNYIVPMLLIFTLLCCIKCGRNEEKSHLLVYTIILMFCAVFTKNIKIIYVIEVVCICNIAYLFPYKINVFILFVIKCIVLFLFLAKEGYFPLFILLIPTILYTNKFATEHFVPNNLVKLASLFLVCRIYLLVILGHGLYYSVVFGLAVLVPLTYSYTYYRFK